VRDRRRCSDDSRLAAFHERSRVRAEENADYRGSTVPYRQWRFSAVSTIESETKRRMTSLVGRKATGIGVEEFNDRPGGDGPVINVMPVKRRVNSLGTLLRGIACTREIETMKRKREGESARGVVDTLSRPCVSRERERERKREQKGQKNGKNLVGGTRFPFFRFSCAEIIS